MKKILIAFALASASLSTGCATLGEGVGVTQGALPAKLLYAAEAIYNVPAQAYVAADSRDQINPALKARIKPKLQQLGDLLDKARTAHRLGSAIDFNARKADLQKLANEISALIP